jgi:hypothetical protein
MHTAFWWKRQKERDHWEDVDVGGRTGLIWMLREVGCEGVDRMQLRQDRNQWRAVVRTLMNLRVHIKCWEIAE